MNTPWTYPLVSALALVAGAALAQADAGLPIDTAPHGAVVLAPPSGGEAAGAGQRLPSISLVDARRVALGWSTPSAVRLGVGTRPATERAGGRSLCDAH